GLLNEVQWDFAPISRPELVNGNKLYTVPEDREVWYTNKDSKREHFYFTSSMPVVTNFRQSNGVGGTNETTYRYKEAIYNRKGRGFQGFRTIIVDSPTIINGAGEVSDKMRSVTDFHQIFPQSGQVEWIHTCLASDEDETCREAPISKTEMAATEKVTAESTDNSSADVYWVWPEFQIVTTFDLADRTEQLSVRANVRRLKHSDNYGNFSKVSLYINTGEGEIQTRILNEHTVDVDNWWIGKLENTMVRKRHWSSLNPVYDATLNPEKEITTTYTYNSARQPIKVVADSLHDESPTQVVETTYNDYGLPEVVKTYQQDKPGDFRTVSTKYSNDGETESEDGYFIYKVTDALSQSTITQTYPEHGQMKKVIDVNGFVTETSYDAFGRIEQVTPPVGQPAYSRFAACEGGCGNLTDSNIRYKVTTYQAGTPQSSVYKDQFNRVKATVTEGFDGYPIYSFIDYDRLGRTIFESIPSSNHLETRGTNYLAFDVLGRLLKRKVDQSDGQSMEVTYAYVKHRTDITAKDMTSLKVLSMSRTHNAQGQLIKTTDALNGVTQYAYDALDNPIVIQDANGNRITAKYNALGQKLEVNDPNMGVKTFAYTSHGEVYSETDANNDTYYYVYDALGRLTNRYLNGTASGNLEATFSYHGSSASCSGVPDKEIRNDLPSGESFNRTYQYDNYCRPSSAITNIDGDSFTSKVFYDGNYGRVKGKQYPSDLIVAYDFNSYGYQNRTKNAQTNAIYRTITSMDHWGNWTQASLGNSSNIEREFYAETGQMKSSILNRYSTQQQAVVYSGYDGFGNLKGQTMGTYEGGSYRLDTESYAYDDLHRLIRSALTLSGSPQPSVDYGYDKVGNFKYKTDFSM
ncbi:MAG: hypothetical protein OQK04_04730, partial [Kangiellaceae bacterium]|nr:hypothetical protein [Kangiellaceae bacterium]